MSEGQNVAGAETPPEPKKPKRYSLRRKVEEIEVELPNGEVKTYTMRDLSGEQRAVWLNKVDSMFKVNDQGIVVGVGDQKGYQSFLVAMVVHDENNKLVDQRQIDAAWPGTTLKQIFEDCRTFCGLNPEGEVAEKKSSTDPKKETGSN